MFYFLFPQYVLSTAVDATTSKSLCVVVVCLVLCSLHVPSLSKPNVFGLVVKSAELLFHFAPMVNQLYFFSFYLILMDALHVTHVYSVSSISFEKTI